MTPDGQAVQVQMQSDDTEFMEDSESVLPDQEVEGHEGMVHSHETSSFQIMPSTVVVKSEENYPMQIDQSSVVSDGNIQVLSSDGSMYFVTSDMAEAPPQPTIQMMSTSEPPQNVVPPTIIDT